MNLVGLKEGNMMQSQSQNVLKFPSKGYVKIESEQEESIVRLEDVYKAPLDEAILFVRKGSDMVLYSY